MVGFFDPKQGRGKNGVPKMDTFSQALAKQLKQSAGISKIEVIKLGNPAATSNADLLYVASNPNYIYYTTEGEEGAGIGMISKEIIPTSLRFPNKTALIFRYGSYVACLPAAGVAEEILAEAAPPVTPNQTPVTTSQLDFAVLQPYIGTMFGVVKGAIYGDIGVADISTADMSDSPLDTSTNPINIPTNANKAIGVLVQLDPATSTLSYKQSAEFPASLSLAQAYQNGLLPLRDVDKKRTGYIKLSNGVTSLDNGNVWPCPEFFPDSSNQPINLPDYNGTPDNTAAIVVQDTFAPYTLHSSNVDDFKKNFTMRITSSSPTLDSLSTLYIDFASTTARTVTIGNGTIEKGHSLAVSVEIAPSSGSHRILLPSGVTFDGTNNCADLDAVGDLILAKAVSTTRYMLFINEGIAYSVV